MDQIELDVQEHELVAAIEFEVLKLHDHIHARRNGEIAAKLADILLSRDAIPDCRIKVFSDDRFTTGRDPSPWKQFQRNGNTKDETLRHPHFLAWLQYFIYGPNLPSSYIRIFQEKIEELAPITSSDSETLRHFTRSLTKQFGLKKSGADEVFKLLLEFEDDVYLAQTMRRETLKVAKSF